MINLQGVEGNLSWFYVLIRKIEGSILANILNLDSLIGSHPFAHLDVKRPNLTSVEQLDDKPTIRPCGLGDRSYTPDFESEPNSLDL
jgi:hypothetical protein